MDTAAKFGWPTACASCLALVNHKAQESWSKTMLAWLRESASFVLLARSRAQLGLHFASLKLFTAKEAGRPVRLGNCSGCFGGGLGVSRRPQVLRLARTFLSQLYWHRLTPVTQNLVFVSAFLARLSRRALPPLPSTLCAQAPQRLQFLRRVPPQDCACSWRPSRRGARAEFPTTCSMAASLVKVSVACLLRRPLWCWKQQKCSGEDSVFFQSGNQQLNQRSTFHCRHTWVNSPPTAHPYHSFVVSDMVSLAPLLFG